MLSKKIIVMLGLCLTTTSITIQADNFVSERTNNAVITVDQNNFDSFIGSGITVVDFYADWCGPCKRLVPVYHELAQEFEGRVKFGKINVDHAQSIANRKNVKQIPTMILFRNGQEITRRGSGTKSEIASWINSAL